MQADSKSHGKSPHVSILTPVRNGLPYLKDCVESIRKQTMQNWEWIIVDDNSTDNTWAYLLELSSLDKRIKVFKNQESGIITALRQALTHAEGDKVTRMDADDLMAAVKLEVLSNLLTEYGEGHVAIGKVEYFATNKLLEQGYKNYANWLNDLTSTGENYKDIYKECVIPSPNWMLYKRDLLKIGAFDFDVYPEDYDLVFRLYRSGIQCIPCEVKTHYWRDHSSRASRIDPNYADNLFLEMKIKNFIALEAQEDEIVLIGAGQKGKWIANYLIDNKEPFIWMTNNNNKIGQDIYGVVLRDQSELAPMKSVKIVVAVSNKDDQTNIERSLIEQRRIRGKDYFYFC